MSKKKKTAKSDNYSENKLEEKHDIMEPVLDEKVDACWLIVKTKLDGISSPKKPIKEVIKENKPLEEKKIFEIKPQGLWLCQKCGVQIQSNPEKPTECHEDQGGCGRSSSFRPVTKIINQDLWKLPTWKDIPVEELNMLEVYDDMLALIKKLLIFSEEIEYEIYTLWIISTWKLECWDTVGYPIFIGLPDSGKSRALRIITQLGYRVLKASGVKQAVIPRLCHYHNITLLIDEAHTKLNPRTESGSGLLDFVKDSYKRGSIYVVCDNDNQENVIVTRNFGFKAFAGEKSFNAGLLSRGLIFWMEKEDPEIAKLSYVEDDLEKLRTKLLNYRFKTSDPQDLGNDFCLKGRTREIFESIIATGQHIGVDVTDIIEYAKKRSEREERALQGTVQYEILTIIKNYEENPIIDDAPDKIKTEKILNDLEWITEDSKENNQKRQSLGYILKNMGLEAKRTGDGRIIDLRDENNEKRLKKLYMRYKLC